MSGHDLFPVPSALNPPWQIYSIKDNSGYCRLFFFSFSSWRESPSVVAATVYKYDGSGKGSWLVLWSPQELTQKLHPVFMVNLVSSLFSFIVHPCLIPVLFYVVISALLQFHSCLIRDLLLFHSCFIRGSLLFYSWSISVPFLSYISCSIPVLFLVRACCIRGSFVVDSCFIRVSFAFHSWFVRVSFVFHSVRVERSKPGLAYCYYCVLGYPAALSLLHIFYTTPPMCLTYPFSPVTEMQSVFLFIWDTEFHFSIQTLILWTCLLSWVVVHIHALFASSNTW